MDDEAAFERVLADQRLLLLPLIRAGADLTVGLRRTFLGGVGRESRSAPALVSVMA